MGDRRPLAFRIVTRILVFNVLIVFLPVVSMLLLDTYEEQLLDALERNLVQQGRILSASLSVGREFDAPTSQALLRALEGRHEARLRVLNAAGELLADSSTLTPVEIARDEADQSADEPLPSGPRESTLYRLASFPIRLFRDLAGDPQSPLPSADFYSRATYATGSEVQAALAGRYGAATRVSGGQISVTLYSALPIVRAGEITGVVLVSQSTFRILQDLYQVRIDVFTIFLWTLAAAVILSIFLALTIARPISVLQRRARAVVDEHGRLTAPLPRENRRDEIGGLSRSLSELTEQIDGYVRRLESFAADASHELKNPLASISANCEMAVTAPDGERRERHLARARSDVRRAQAILTAMRELAHIDARVDAPGQCSFAPAVAEAVAELATRYPAHSIVFERDTRSDAFVPVSEDRVYQIVSNLVGNAQGFAAPGSRITVRASREAKGSVAELAVMDEGPGFEEPERVFDRFYSARPERDGHLGLGLSIVQAIAESVGGSVSAENRTDGRSGALARVRLPLSS